MHHLKHRSEGGETTVENGAVINELAHRYIHSLPREHEEIINDMLREYKTSFELQNSIIVTTKSGLQIEEPLSIFSLEDDEEFMTLELNDITEEIQEKRFNRAKEKRESKRLAEEGLLKYLEGEDRDE